MVEKEKRGARGHLIPLARACSARALVEFPRQLMALSIRVRIYTSYNRNKKRVAGVHRRGGAASGVAGAWAAAASHFLFSGRLTG